MVKCSFCGKFQKGVKKLIAGPGVYICEECVGICVCILKEESIEPPAPEPPLQGSARFRRLFDRIRERSCTYRVGAGADLSRVKAMSWSFGVQAVDPKSILTKAKNNRR